MKKRFLMLLTLFGLLQGLLIGCDSGSSTTSTDNLALTGTASLSTGEAASGYTIVVVSSDNETVASGTVESDGSFSVNLPAGEYSISAFDENMQLAAVLVLSDGSSTITVSESENVGALTIDEDADTISSSSLSATAAGLKSATAAASVGDLFDIGDPRSSGLDLDSVFDDDIADNDGDLIPDFLDLDADDDGLFDNVGRMPKCVARIVEAPAGVSVLDGLEDVQCRVFMNLKLPIESILAGTGDGDLHPHTADNIVTIEFLPGTKLTGSVTSAKIVTSPPYSSPEISMVATGYTFGTYPTGDLWDDHSRELFQGTNLDGNEVWTVWIDPNTDPRPGQLFVFEIKVGAVTVRAATIIHFVLSTPPKVVSVSSSSGTTAISYPSTVGSSSSPITFSGDLTLTANRPLYWAIAAAPEVCGLYYHADIFYYDASDNQIGNGAIMASTYDDPAVVPCNSSPAGQISMTVPSADLPDVVDGTAVAKYKVDFTYSGLAGDNSSNMIWFTK